MGHGPHPGCRGDAGRGDGLCSAQLCPKIPVSTWGLRAEAPWGNRGDVGPPLAAFSPAQIPPLRATPRGHRSGVGSALPTPAEGLGTPSFSPPPPSEGTQSSLVQGTSLPSTSLQDLVPQFPPGRCKTLPVVRVPLRVPPLSSRSGVWGGGPGVPPPSFSPLPVPWVLMPGAGPCRRGAWTRTTRW